MSKSRTVKIGDVIAAVIRKDDCYLVCQRPIHKNHGGLWEFPGGKVEQGETFEEAAEREIKEELNLQVVGTGKLLFSVIDSLSGFTINFVEVHVSGELALSEHIAYRWVSISDLQSLQLAPSDRQFAQSLLQTD